MQAAGGDSEGPGTPGTRARGANAAAWRASIESLGTALTPEFVVQTKRLAADAMPADLLTGIDITPDARYGDHERHRLDVYRAAAPAAADAGAPILLYVHGGGFVAGDKGSADSLFGPNLGAWAARRGMVGVAMNYRLAPEASWPDGGADVGSAVAWLRDHAAEFGGDPERIVVLGQSAGAMHVADYLGLHAQGRAPGAAAAVLVSCMYDVASAKDLPMHRAYWGDDLGAWAAKGSIDTVLETEVPLLLAVAEWDDEQFHQSAAALVAAWHERRGTFAPIVTLPSHNHLSTVYAVGTPHDRLMSLVEPFIAEHTAGR
ncbi:MAG: alpha/beta hydrolase [Pseudoclavibacter sp.]